MEQGGLVALRRALGRATIYVILAVGVLAFRRDPTITGWYFAHQDIQVGIAFVILWLLALWLRPRLPWPGAGARLSIVVAAAAVFAGLLWWGTHAVMLDYPLTRDELMVEFDRTIFAS